MSNQIPSTPSEAPAATNELTNQSPRYISHGPVRPGTILSTPATRRDAFDRIMTYLRRLAKERFFGNVEITLRDGEVQVLRTEQTLKLCEIGTAATPDDNATALGTTTAVAGGAR